MNAPGEIARNYIEIGVGKADTPKGKMFLLAVLAGMFIAFAGVAATVGNAVVNKLAGACIFPAGLAMVTVAGSELFTGNNLMIIPVMEKRLSVKKLLLAWLIVYLGNFVGSILVAVASVAGGTFAAYYETLTATAAAKVSLSFGEAVLRGILCNILVCTAVWMAFAAKEPAGKILGLYFPIMVFVICGFEHCVANMFYLPAGLLAAGKYGVAEAGLTWGACFGKNLLPVTLGNMIGGVGMGLVFWGIHLRARAKETV